jgi:hypothetical protein
VATDSAGNVVLTGFVTGEVDFDAGPKPGGDKDIFLAKFNRAGDAIVSPRFVASGPQQANAIALDALGNIAITGAFNGTVKLDDAVELVSVSPILNPPGATDAFLAVFRP